MTTDLVIRISPDAKEHTQMIGIFADDGAVIGVKIKHFTVPLKAKNLRAEQHDWQSWRNATPEELETYKRLRSKNH